MRRTTFVIDTNVLLHDPEAVLKFPGQHVVVPVSVLEELDTMKRFRDELGQNARAAIRTFDRLKDEGTGDLHQGVEIANGALVRIQLEVRADYSPGLELKVPKNKIITAAYLLHEQGESVVFVSKSLSARIKAEAVGLVAEDYRYLKVPLKELYAEIRQATISKKAIDHFFRDGILPMSEVGAQDLHANQYFQLTSPEGSSTMARYNIEENVLDALLPLERDLWGVEPANRQQRCAVDLLLRDDVNLVTLMGPAGTGKTLLALACGLRKVFDEAVYTRIIVSRPIMPLGKDIGYLPGTKEEKLYHWMQPIHDNLEFLCSTKGNHPTDTLRWVLESKRLEMEAVTYIRGRSLPKSYMIIDEAQNLTPHELKTVISRAGEGTKVVLTGDPTQIDNPYLDEESNGLSYTASLFRDLPLFGHAYMTITERSRLAAAAADIL